MDEVTKAKEVLRNAGYFVDNLWCNDDIQSFFTDVSKEECQKVLDRALRNDATMEQIWYAIECVGEDMGLKRTDYDDDEDTCSYCGRKECNKHH
jgi:hypothetical protein